MLIPRYSVPCSTKESSWKNFSLFNAPLLTVGEEACAGWLALGGYLGSAHPPHVHQIAALPWQPTVYATTLASPKLHLAYYTTDGWFEPCAAAKRVLMVGNPRIISSASNRPSP